MSRPEDDLSADIHYNDAQARKYTTSSRMQRVQADMASRALQLLGLTRPSLILDVGCGSGLSGEVISGVTADDGGPHTWIGFDVAPSMLDVALQRAVDGDLLLADAGQGVPFRPGTFDAAISISAIQWLCSAETSDTSAHGRLQRFFEGLYASLRRGGRAVLQFYPRNDTQRQMITSAAVRAGFGAGVLEDEPGTKKVKVYLVLTVGGSAEDGCGGDISGVVAGMDGVEVHDARRGKGSKSGRSGKGLIAKGSRAWIVQKKGHMEKRGMIVRPTTKYTGRKRRPQF